MRARVLGIFGVMLALGLVAPALAQTTYPTAAGATSRVAGVVPLQCNSSGQACAPVSSTNPGGPNQVVGDVANDGVNSGNPVQIGGRAANTPPSAVANGDRVSARYDLYGTAAVNLYSNNGFEMAISFDSSDGQATGNSGYTGVSRNFVFNGSTWDRSRGDQNGLVVQNGLSSTYWSYANGAAGILSNTTTAVTIKAAAGASVRNYVESCQINTTAFGTSVPLAIRDGAGGTVIWAVNVPTAGFLQPVTIVFAIPLRSTANTLLEVVTTTANTSGTAWVNCQGHTGP